jgi:SSS family transporter
MIGVGVYLSRRERTKADYFRGGRQIPFWASGLSLFATGASGISLMAMPGRAFEDNWAYLTISFFVVLSYPLVLLVYVPIARRLNVSTANEYLERRYNLTLRLAGSVVYSLNQILARLAAIMILPAIAISAIAGIPMETSILVMGLVTTLYATLGGLEGVIWTDVIQAIVMLLAVFLCATWALIALQADPGTAFAAIQSAEKLRSFDLTISLLGPTSLVLFANVMATTVSMIGDQNFIQRVQCTPTEKDARKAVITQISVAVPLNVILFTLGTILFLFYRERPEMLNPTLKADGIFPLFAAQNLPAGLAGLVIAALFAATMSTLSSAINSTANLGVEDFYRRLYPRASDRGCLILGRGLTCLLGVIGTFAALWLLKSDLRSVWDLAIMLTGMILAPIAGIFFLGIFTTRANSTGVIIGAAAAIAVTYLVKTYTPIHHFLYLPVGVVSCVLVGYLASCIIPGVRKELKGLTAFTIYREKSD